MEILPIIKEYVAKHQHVDEFIGMLFFLVLGLLIMLFMNPEKAIDGISRGLGPLFKILAPFALIYFFYRLRNG